MLPIFVTVQESMIQLRRDRVFVPGLVLSLLIVFAGFWVRDLTLAMETKILSDLYRFVLHIVIGAIALFWGVDLISGNEKRSSMEYRLVGPISRESYYCGIYLGLVLSLAGFGLLLLIGWYFNSLFNAVPFNFVTELGFFFAHYLGWMVLIAMGMLFATLASFHIALFVSFVAWFCGLVANLFSESLPPTMPSLFKFFIRKIGQFWDLSRFNIAHPETVDLFLFCYAAGLIVIMLALGSISFSRMDLR